MPGCGGGVGGGGVKIVAIVGDAANNKTAAQPARAAQRNKPTDREFMKTPPGN
jgi:hypothetical protein